ncbi:MAG: deoxyuridine 5'-triphosphate nucleotidohydrolase [Niallia sp.]
MTIQVGFKKLSEHAIIPTKAHETDSGFDLYAAGDVIVEPGQTVVVKTDIALVLPEGHEAQVRPRSGITSKTKLRVQLGTIDNPYRGNIGITVDNFSQKFLHAETARTKYMRHLDNSIAHNYEGYHLHETYLIRKGDKLAQLIIQALPAIDSVEVFELDETDRGINGFGSSGVQG